MAKRKRRRFTPEFKAAVVLEPFRGECSLAELCRHHNLSEDQRSKWKHQLVENAAFVWVSSRGKQSSEATERITHLEQLVGRLKLALDIEKTDLKEEKVHLNDYEDIHEARAPALGNLLSDRYITRSTHIRC